MRSTILVALIFSIGTCAAQAPQRSTYRWTQFVNVEGQPEPVPVEWVSTAEGKFAHSIKIPNPVPKDSGYRSGMSSEQYFEHLCKTEAGEFVYKTVEDVEGLYLMRPPKRPSDDDLMDRYKLEAPEIERLFHVLRDTPNQRAQLFVNPPWRKYLFVEEPTQSIANNKGFVRSSGYKQNVSPMKGELTESLKSQYGLIWRGIKRPEDREHSIAGGEWIVLDLTTQDPIAVLRTFGRSPRVNNTPDRIWWFSAAQCRGAKRIPTAAGNIEQLYQFTTQALSPSSGSGARK